MHNLLFWPYTLCMSYVSFYWLVPQYRVNNCFFFVHGQGQKSEQKPTTKNFVGFHNNSALLTMIERPKMFRKKNPRLHTERTLVKMMKPFAVGLQKSFQIFGIRNFRYQYGTLYFCFKNVFY